MAVTPVSEAEAIADPVALLSRVRSGEEIVIEADGVPVAVMKAAEPKGRRLSESIALAEAHAKERGYDVRHGCRFRRRPGGDHPQSPSRGSFRVGVTLDSIVLKAGEQHTEFMALKVLLFACLLLAIFPQRSTAQTPTDAIDQISSAAATNQKVLAAIKASKLNSCDARI